MREVIYARYSDYRRPRFRILTRIVQEGDRREVVKTPLDPEAEAHVRQLPVNAQLAETLYEGCAIVSPCKLDGDAAVFPYVEGKPFADLLQEFVEVRDREGLRSALRRYVSLLEGSEANRIPFAETEAFREIFPRTEIPGGCPALRISNLDATPGNLISARDGLVVLDYEWIYSFPVPRDFVVYRNMRFLYASSGIDVSSLLSFEECVQLCAFELPVPLLDALNQEYHQFITDAGGEDAGVNLAPYLQAAAPVEGPADRCKHAVYCDTGDGYSEREVIRFPPNAGEQVLAIPADGVREVRFDAFGGSGAVFRGLRFRLNGKDLPYQAPGAAGEGDLLVVGEPGYVFCSLPEDAAGELRISGSFTGFVEGDPETANELVKTVARLSERPEAAVYETLKRKLKEEKKELGRVSRERRSLEESLEKARAEYAGTAQELQAVRASRSWQVTAGARKAGDLARRVRGRLRAGKKGPGGVQYALLRPADGGPGGELMFRWCTEVFRFDESKLAVVGWMYAEGAPIESAQIVVQTRSERVFAPCTYGLPRSDVRDAFPGWDNEHCGFSFSGFVHIPKKAEAYLECQAGSAVYRVKLGKLQPQGEPSALSIIPHTQQLDAESLCVAQRRPQLPYKGVWPEVDLVIPVYQGLKYLGPLLDSLVCTEVPIRMLVVDDCSPDPAVLSFLESRAAADPRIHILRNERNMGFVRSVNRGLAEARGHVVLVNTDVVVPPRWLERLLRPIVDDEEHVGSVTPFTNAGTLCSFPVCNADNPLFAGLSPDQIDSAFSRIPPANPEIPTGVGFCMALNHRALAAVGALDAEAFGRGYAEENDWCMRAAAAGFRHVAADNLFVFHNHGGSFTSEEKKKLLAQNLDTLNRRHPLYNERIAAFLTCDPLRPVREYAKFALIEEHIACSAPGIFIVAHSIGGGADSYLVKERARWHREGKKTLTMTWEPAEELYRLQMEAAGYSAEKWVRAPEDAGAVLEENGIRQIVLNELVSYPDVPYVVTFILEEKKRLGCTLTVLLHDFYAVCPSYTLLDADGKFCGVPGDAAICESCTKAFAALDGPGAVPEDIRRWRAVYGSMLEAAEEVVTFSKSSADLLRRAYPQDLRIVVRPHKVEYLVPLDKKYSVQSTLNIGLLGAIGVHKGAAIVEKMLELIRSTQADIDIHLIGSSSVSYGDSHFAQTGPYSWENLPFLTLEQDIDIFLIPSIWPETFCYTAEEVMQMGLPVACYDLGAPAERVSRYEKGIILPDMDPQATLRALVAYAEENDLPKIPRYTGRVLIVQGDNASRCRRLAHQLREQLLFEGIGSALVPAEQLRNTNPNGWNHVFFVAGETESAEARQFLVRAGGSGASTSVCTEGPAFSGDAGEEEMTEHRARRKSGESRPGTHPSNLEIAAAATMAEYLLARAAVRAAEKSEEEVLVGYAGSQEGLDELSPLMARMMSNDPQIRLRVLGDARPAGPLDAFSGRTEMKDVKTPAEVFAALADLHLFLLPERAEGCLPSALQRSWIRAALCALPVVTDAEEALSPVVRSGQDAFLCTEEAEWESALHSLLRDRALRADMGHRARERVTACCLTKNTGGGLADLVLGVQRGE